MGSHCFERWECAEQRGASLGHVIRSHFPNIYVVMCLDQHLTIMFCDNIIYKRAKLSCIIIFPMGIALLYLANLNNYEGESHTQEEKVERGGLGFTRLKLKTNALLLKQCFRMLLAGGNSRQHLNLWIGGRIRCDLVPDVYHHIRDLRRWGVDTNAPLFVESLTLYEMGRM